MNISFFDDSFPIFMDRVKEMKMLYYINLLVMEFFIFRRHHYILI